MSQSPGFTVRKVALDDFEAWNVLWQAYLVFYKTTLAADVTRYTFERACADDGTYVGFVAETPDGQLIGMANCIYHAGTFSTKKNLYLEDLYVDPAARTGGVGRAILEAIMAEGRAQDCRKVYWQTERTNAVAQVLYNKFTEQGPLIRYDVMLDE